MKGELEIREIRPEDAEAISEIDLAITKSGKKIDFGKIIIEHIKKGDGVSLVATVNQRLVGYMICYFINAGFGLEKSAWIATLGVDPRYMGQGIGRRLAQEILKRCKDSGIRHIFTSVRWDSADLLSFFKTLGFSRSDFINLVKELQE